MLQQLNQLQVLLQSSLHIGMIVVVYLVVDTFLAQTILRQRVNASWVPFSSTPCWGNATLTLNSNVGATVGFREYANNSLNLWGASGIYAITTTNGTSPFTPNPSPSPTSTTIPDSAPTPTSIVSSTPTPNPTATPTLQPETNMFPTQTVAIATVAIVVLVTSSALAFKKGYLLVEVVNDKGGETIENEGDYEGSEKENQDYSI
jgi:hypothetical protein